MPAGSDHCWICRWEERHAEKTDEGKGAAKPMAAPATPAKVKLAQAARTTKTSTEQSQQSTSIQFTASALLVVAFLVLAFSVNAESILGLVIGFILLISPALIRTIVIASRKQELGRAMSIEQKIYTLFMAAITLAGILLVTFLAAAIAFGAVCLPGLLIDRSKDPYHNVLFFICLAVAFVAAVPVVFLLVRKWFRH